MMDLMQFPWETLIWQVLSKLALTSATHASKKKGICIESITDFSFHLDHFYLFQALVVPPVISVWLPQDGTKCGTNQVHDFMRIRENIIARKMHMHIEQN